MKKLLGALLLVPTLLLAQVIEIQKPVQCGNTNEIIEYLTKGEFVETPIWFGISNIHNFSLLTNIKSGTWTLIEFNDDIACILGTGEKFKLVPQGKQI